ncbi:hypothetical protein GWL_29660 [Herbaspirillum sp. GW103]|nr:hypothetical protein GWL_29660 [Herbaspirillum sp. GW103]
MVRVMCDLALREITKDGQMPIFFLLINFRCLLCPRWQTGILMEK